MSVKKVVKKSSIKKAVKKEVEKEVKKVDKKKETKVASPNRQRRVFMAGLVIEQKYTDAEIAAKCNEKFPVTPENEASLKKPFEVSKVSGIRWHIEQGSFKPEIPAKKYDRIIKIDGERIPFSQRPKRKTKAAPKYTPETDPLNKVAGIDVNKEADAAAIKKVKKVVKKKK